MAQSLANGDGSASGYANSRLPAWLQLGGEERMRLEDLNGVGFLPAANTYILHRLRFNIDVTPRPWLKFVFQAQDSRVFFTNVAPAPASQKDPLDLRLGYLQIGDSESGLVSLRAGRQGLTFGEGRLLADPNWSNVGRTFDGLRATFRYRKLRVDVFSGASDKVCIDGFDTTVPAEHFHGIHGLLDKAIRNATVESYLFWKLEHGVKGELVRSGNLDLKTAGLRWVGKLPFGFDYGLELAIQQGRQANERASASAGHWVLGRTTKVWRYWPRIFVEWNHASGDGNPHDGVHEAFDPLFASSHDKFGAADQFTWSNILHLRSGIQSRVREGLMLGTAYNSFWLANRSDGIYSGGRMILGPSGSGESHISQELDLLAQWNAGRHTLVDLVLGRVLPGGFLRGMGRSSVYNSLALGVTQRF
jgi:hypothetical protein